MREITYKTLLELQEIDLNDSQITVNRVMIYNAKKILIEPIESLIVQLDILNSQDKSIATFYVGTNERLLVNDEWSYIERR